MGMAFVTILGLFTAGMLLCAFGLTAITFLRGITRLRFSLRSLMCSVFSGGVCATLLTFPRESVWYLFGVLFTTVYAAFLLTHILGLGGMREAEWQAERQSKHEHV